MCTKVCKQKMPSLYAISRLLISILAPRVTLPLPLSHLQFKGSDCMNLHRWTLINHMLTNDFHLGWKEYLVRTSQLQFCTSLNSCLDGHRFLNSIVRAGADSVFQTHTWWPGKQTVFKSCVVLLKENLNDDFYTQVMHAL